MEWYKKEKKGSKHTVITKDMNCKNLNIIIALKSYNRVVILP